MKALVFHKPKDVRYETVPDPRIENGNYTATANTLTLSSYFSASSTLVLGFVKL